MDSKLRTMWMLGVFSVLCLGWSVSTYFKDRGIADTVAKAGTGARMADGGGGAGGMRPATAGAGGGSGGGQGRRPQNLTAKVTVDQAIKAATAVTKGFVNSATLRSGQSGDVWMVHIVTKPGEGDIPGEGKTYLVDPITGVATLAPARGGPGAGGPGGAGGRRGAGGRGSNTDAATASSSSAK